MHELRGLNLEVPGFACAQSGRRASRLPSGDATRHHDRTVVRALELLLRKESRGTLNPCSRQGPCPRCYLPFLTLARPSAEILRRRNKRRRDRRRALRRRGKLCAGEGTPLRQGHARTAAAFRGRAKQARSDLAYISAATVEVQAAELPLRSIAP